MPCPGELHAKKYRDDPDAQGVDRTIVNPDKLDRALSESICQQCHLAGAGKATILAEIAFRKGEKERAAELFAQAARYNRDVRDTFYLGLSQYNLGDVKQAIATLEKSLEIDRR